MQTTNNRFGFFLATSILVVGWFFFMAGEAKATCHCQPLSCSSNQTDTGVDGADGHRCSGDEGSHCCEDSNTFPDGGTCLASGATCTGSSTCCSNLCAADAAGKFVCSGTGGTGGGGTVGGAGTGGGTATGTGWNISSIGGYGLPSAPGGIMGIISGILSWLLSALGLLGVIGFLISGVMYLISTGDEDMIERAKSAMTYSLIGVIVGLIGVVIIQAIDWMLRGYSGF
jgi:hypothetical protein